MPNFSPSNNIQLIRARRIFYKMNFQKSFKALLLGGEGGGSNCIFNNRSVVQSFTHRHYFFLVILSFFEQNKTFRVSLPLTSSLTSSPSSISMAVIRKIFGVLSELFCCDRRAQAGFGVHNITLCFSFPWSKRS